MKSLRATAVVLALACASCRSMETVRGYGFVLHSPFGAEATETWRKRVAHELRGVEYFIEQPTPDPPIDLVLEAIDVDENAGIVAQLAPRVDGIGGWTVGDEVHVIVSRANDGLLTTTADGVLRHEFVHALLHRAGVRAPAWLGEGLAHEVEDCVWTSSGLYMNRAPVQLELARAYATTFDVSRVWSWDGSPKTPPDDQSALRVLSRSFVRFLYERDVDESRDGRFARWAALRPADDARLVEAWRSWLDRWSFALHVSRTIVWPDESAINVAAANALPELAELASTARDRVPGIERSVNAETDSLALWLATSDDAALAEPAGRYLVYFRARDVTESGLHDLSDGAAPPWTRLIALAVAARRGGNAEPSEAQSLWNSLPSFERMRFLWLASLLQLTRSEQSPGR